MSRYSIGLAIAVASLSASASALAVDRSINGDPISAEAAAVQRAQVKKFVKAARVDGLFGDSTWQLNFDWGCLSTPSSAITYVKPDYTFTVQDYSGTWAKDKKTIVFTFAPVEPYGSTVYSGLLSQDNQHASGTMVSYLGGTGCWTADRL